MTGATQQTLDLRTRDGLPLTFLRRSMVGIDTVKAVLDVNEDEVMELIGDGRLRWAWDLTSVRNAKRSYVRVWSRSVFAYIQGTIDAQPGALDDVIDALLPASAKMTGRVRATGLSGTALQKIFNVSSGHVLNLLREEALTQAPRSEWRRGPGGSPEVTKGSVVALLRERRLP